MKKTIQHNSATSKTTCRTSAVDVARAKGAVGRATPIQTGAIRALAVSHSSSTAMLTRACKARRHFICGCDTMLLHTTQHVSLSNTVVCVKQIQLLKTWYLLSFLDYQELNLHFRLGALRLHFHGQNNVDTDNGPHKAVAGKTCLCHALLTAACLHLTNECSQQYVQHLNVTFCKKTMRELVQTQTTFLV